MGKSRTMANDPDAPREFSTNALAQDFNSFDILWFDLSTKTRALVTELSAPLIDKVHVHKDLLSKLIKSNDDNDSKIDELERTVFNKGMKLTIFEEIYRKISKVESERLEIEAGILNDHSRILKQFDEMSYRFD
jgi:hypothetical protein